MDMPPSLQATNRKRPRAHARGHVQSGATSNSPARRRSRAGTIVYAPGRGLPTPASNGQIPAEPPPTIIQGAKTILKLDWNRAFEFTWRILVFIVAIGIVIVVTTNWGRWEGGAGWQSTNDAYLQADLTPISAKVGGYLRELPVQDYERVHKDQVIAQLVDDDYRAAVAQAQASIESATAQAAALKAQQELQLATIEAAHAVVASATASFEQNGRDLARQRRLLETGSSSTEASERLSTSHAQLEALLMQNRAQARAAERQLAVLEAQIAQSEAAVAAQHAALDAANLNIGYTTITATQDGVIGQRQAKA